MADCSFCGKALGDGAAFCGECGHRAPVPGGPGPTAAPSRRPLRGLTSTKAGKVLSTHPLPLLVCVALLVVAGALGGLFATGTIGATRDRSASPGPGLARAKGPSGSKAPRRSSSSRQAVAPAPATTVPLPAAATTTTTAAPPPPATTTTAPPPPPTTTTLPAPLPLLVTTEGASSSPTWSGIEPAALTTSNDSTGVILSISWSSWTATGATGLGSWQENNCEPSCNQGTITPTPATIQLSQPQNGIFTSMVITTLGGPYAGSNTYTYPNTWALYASSTNAPFETVP